MDETANELFKLKNINVICGERERYEEFLDLYRRERKADLTAEGTIDISNSMSPHDRINAIYQRLELINRRIDGVKDYFKTHIQVEGDMISQLGKKVSDIELAVNANSKTVSETDDAVNQVKTRFDKVNVALLERIEKLEEIVKLIDRSIPNLRITNNEQHDEMRKYFMEENQQLERKIASIEERLEQPKPMLFEDSRSCREQIDRLTIKIARLDHNEQIGRKIAADADKRLQSLIDILGKYAHGHVAGYECGFIPGSFGCASNAADNPGPDNSTSDAPATTASAHRDHTDKMSADYHHPDCEYCSMCGTYLSHLHRKFVLTSREDGDRTPSLAIVCGDCQQKVGFTGYRVGSKK